ncbi:MAG: glycosyltransferase [Hyphomicrobium sp.]|nr:glycosyltransferase [Hyphomicrobium sp.]
MLQHPRLSAAAPMVLWQKAALFAVVIVVAAALWTDSEITAAVVMTLLTPAFLCVSVLRTFAVHEVLNAPLRSSPAPPPAEPDVDWPVYSILLPLYREAHMAASIVAALERLKWPAEKRDIIFITEADDTATRFALQTEIHGRAGMRIVTVPPGSPRTKPRALMYALPLATGAFVVVYDAEDDPEPSQLQEAYVRFTESGPDLGCLQARLNIYNPDKSWTTRQFTLEYTALFDAILPAIERLSLPVPLGGTSNHFRREALENSGGWDPYNVTEDADLGIRLARMGWRVEMLNSTTWEEAPPTNAIWLGQRTRWLKGWMQTSLVHLREPARLLSDLGLGGFIGFNVLMGGVILSALVHPLVYVYAFWKLGTGDLSLWPPQGWQAIIWWSGVANLAFAYTVAIVLAFLAVWRRHGVRLAARAVLMPLYWMMISAAAYRAIVDLIRSPFHWRKTEHAARSSANSLTFGPEGR